MTDMELAEEIEKLKKVTADYGYAEPRLLVRESLADQIIAALRRADLAQTEIKGHMRVVDEFKVDAARYRFIRNLLAIEDVERLIADGNPTPDEQESLRTDDAIDLALKTRA